jgi:hypothetical protein
MLPEQQNEISTVLERKGLSIQGQTGRQKDIQVIPEGTILREDHPLSSDIVAFCSLLARVVYRLVQSPPRSGSDPQQDTTKGKIA